MCTDAVYCGIRQSLGVLITDIVGMPVKAIKNFKPAWMGGVSHPERHARSSGAEEGAHMAGKWELWCSPQRFVLHCFLGLCLQLLEYLGMVIYEALDWGIDSQVERELSSPLEKLLCLMLKLDDEAMKPPVSLQDVIKVSFFPLSRYSSFRGVDPTVLLIKRQDHFWEKVGWAVRGQGGNICFPIRGKRQNHFRCL